MAGYDTQTEKNSTLDWKVARYLYVSAHTADPGATGAHEATGGSPAYVRKPVTWNAASGGQVTAATLPTFDVPAGSYTHLGFWSTGSGGTYYHKTEITPQTYAAQDTLTITSITIDYNATADA